MEFLLRVCIIGSFLHPGRFDYEEVVASTEGVKEFIAHFMQYGLAFLSNTPHQPGDILKVIDKSGHYLACAFRL